MIGIVVLLLAISTQLVAAALGFEVTELTDELGVSEDTLQAGLFVLAMAVSCIGLLLLRLMPRALPPMGALAPGEGLADGDSLRIERVAHVIDPLQSVYVAVILIAGVLLVGTIT
jgi:hypothetical protein